MRPMVTRRDADGGTRRARGRTHDERRVGVGGNKGLGHSVDRSFGPPARRMIHGDHAAGSDGVGEEPEGVPSLVVCRRAPPRRTDASKDVISLALPSFAFSVLADKPIAAS